MKNIFLFGYYGFDNLGDDLILTSIIEKFNSEFKFNVLTYNYQKTSELVDVTPVSRSKFFAIINCIKNSDIIATGGGSLLQDETSSKSLYFYLGLILLGELFNKKVIFNQNGIILKIFLRKIISIEWSSIELIDFKICTLDNSEFGSFVDFNISNKNFVPNLKKLGNWDITIKTLEKESKIKLITVPFSDISEVNSIIYSNSNLLGRL